MNHTPSNDSVSASVSAAGAELISLKNAQGLELLRQAGPVWPRHAPILFPIVGRLKNDELRHRANSIP
jgi:galactose mutarotase-like enzyme